MGPHRHELTEEQWRRIKDVLPPEQGRAGRRPRPNREMVNAILWVLRSGAPWRDLPERDPKWKSVHTRFLRWSKRGVWKRVLDVLAADLDDELAMIDASIVRVHQDAAGGKKTAVAVRGGAFLREDQAMPPHRNSIREACRHLSRDGASRMHPRLACLTVEMISAAE